MEPASTPTVAPAALPHRPASTGLSGPGDPTWTTPGADPSGPPGGGPPSAASIFNGYVLAHALFGLWDLGLLDQLASDEGLDATTAAAAGAGTGALLDPLVGAGLAVSGPDGGWHLTPAGTAVVDEVGFLIWAVGGYGRVFHDAAGIAAGHLAYGRDVRRDDARVVSGSALAARLHVAPHVHHIVDRLSRAGGLHRVVDMGCGNAQFLIELCRRHPELTAVGVDISRAACELALGNIQQAGLADRITVTCASFRETAGDGTGSDETPGSGDGPGSIWSGADLVTSFFMLHDLMADPDRAVSDLRGLRDQLPAGARLLIADTVRREPGDDPSPPIFSLGFHLAHALMGVRLWSTGDYEKVFAAAGLSVERRIATSIPSTWLYLLR